MTGLSLGQWKLQEDAPQPHYLLHVIELFRLLAPGHHAVVPQLRQADCGYLGEKFPAEVATISRTVCLSRKLCHGELGHALVICLNHGRCVCWGHLRWVFQSRRGPVAAVLYGLMLLGGIVMVFTYKTTSSSLACGVHEHVHYRRPRHARARLPWTSVERKTSESPWALSLSMRVRQ